jgi:hypothetical protein
VQFRRDHAGTPAPCVREVDHHRHELDWKTGTVKAAGGRLAGRERRGAAGDETSGLRSTFVTISLAVANGRSERWGMDRTGRRSSATVRKMREARPVRRAAERKG